MSSEDTHRLADLLRAGRLRAGLTAREVARRTGLDVTTITRLEQGQITSPRPDRLRIIGEALGIAPADLFAASDWLTGEDLPSFRPYLRAKYRQLPPEAVAEIEAVFDRLARDYNGPGPIGGEDEQPDPTTS